MTGSKNKVSLVSIDEIFTDEFVGMIVVNDLKRIYDYMTHDLEKYDKEDHGFIAVFSVDPKEDKKQIESFAEAIKKVLEYYGEEV